MDFVRYPYQAMAQFDTLGNVVAPIRWYPAKAGAVLFPGRHSFGSSVWQRSQVPQPGGPGEIRPMRAPPFVTPAIPGRPDGTAPDGPLAWFADGQPVGAPGIARTPSGIPSSCAVVPPPLFGPCDSFLLSGTLTTAFTGSAKADMAWAGTLWTGLNGAGDRRWVLVCSGGSPPGVLIEYQEPGTILLGAWDVYQVGSTPPLFRAVGPSLPHSPDAPDTFPVTWVP